MSEDKKIHDTAIVEANVTLGEQVVIGPYCIVKEGAKIGDRTKLISNVRVEGCCDIGKDNEIHHSAVIGNLPQDLKYDGEDTKVKIGEHNVIREFVTIHRATTQRWVTEIGSDNFLMAYSHVAHDCKLGDDVVLTNAANMGGHVTIEDGVNIGGLAGIHQYVTIGEYAFLGAVRKVSKDVVPYIKVGQTPAKPMAVNTVGLRRNGFGEETIRVLKKTYKILFRQNSNTSTALESIKKNVKKTPEVKHLIDFVESSERGILR